MCFDVQNVIALIFYVYKLYINDVSYLYKAIIPYTLMNKNDCDIVLEIAFKKYSPTFLMRNVVNDILKRTSLSLL